mgnify:CR=1 FL=1
MVRLQRAADRRSALRTYLFSLAYLALLFIAMVVDAREVLTGRGLQPADVGDSWLNQTYRQVVEGKWR